MNELLVRTEDIDDDEIPKLFVESSTDRDIIDKLKSRTPIILVGSRGVGKSFLMKVALSELLKNFQIDRILPVYVSFMKSSLIAVSQAGAFQYWMLARICRNIVRQLRKQGLIVANTQAINILSGGTASFYDTPRIETICDQFENSWRNAEVIDTSLIPTVEDTKEAIEDICGECNITRIVLLIDEAAHNFIRSQQIEFFTLFRDLRCAKLTCNAAVYPGVTAFGDTFQMAQDATFLYLNRNISDSSYQNNMKEMVLRQIEDTTLIKEVTRRGQEFSDLSYTASGNPRFLLTIIRNVSKFSTAELNQQIKVFYRDTLLRDHTTLSEKYPNLKPLIDWGRKFVEDTLMPTFKQRNAESILAGKPTTCYFWIHKDAPEPVKRAISLLEYTGIVQTESIAIKSSSSEIGNRYMLNIGCILSIEALPLSVSHNVIDNLDKRRFIEFGANNAIFNEIKDIHIGNEDFNISETLNQKLNQNISCLYISTTMKEKLNKLNINTLRELLEASEEKLKEAYYVGDKRARRMKAKVFASVYEYLIG